MQHKFKHYFKIKTKVTLSIVFFALIFMGIISYFSYLNYLQLSREELNQHALILAEITSLQVDGDTFKLLLPSEGENTENYIKTHSVLQKIRQNVPEIGNIYTMRENENNEIIFVVSDSSLDPSILPHLGDVYTTASTFLKENFKKIDNAVVEKEPYTDNWGTWFSGYSPIYDSNGNKVGMLGVDMKALDILNKENKVRTLYIITFLLAGLFASLVGLFLSRRITDSITSLNNILKDEKNFDIFPSTNDEMGEIRNAIENIIEKKTESQIKVEEQLISKTKQLEEVSKHLSENDQNISQLKKEIQDLRELFFKK